MYINIESPMGSPFMQLADYYSDSCSSHEVFVFAYHLIGSYFLYIIIYKMHILNYYKFIKNTWSRRSLEFEYFSDTSLS